jgi:8-oxo-dGTP pyrophosphatase MutT (NUDIX family)
MIWTPHATVAVVVERDGRFLMVEEETDEGIRLNQPAGHFESNESLVEAAVRETLEETACHVELEHLIGIYRWPRPGTDVVYLRFAFSARLIRQDASRPLDHGILRALWLTRDELVAETPRHRNGLVLRCIDDHLAGRHYPLDLLVHYP